MSSQADQPFDSKPLIRSRPLKKLAVMAGIFVCLAIGCGWAWFKFGLSSNSGAVVQTDSAKWEAYGTVQKYSGENSATVDTYSDEVHDSLAKLEPDLANLDIEVRATETRLRASDPHLDRALRDPRNTPLIGPNGGRTVSDSDAERAGMIQHMLSDFDKHFVGPADVKELLRQPLLVVLNGEQLEFWLVASTLLNASEGSLV